MNTLVRFWLIVGSLLVGLAGFGYLFFSFVYPDAALVTSGPVVRLGVMFVALVASSVFVWTVMFVEPETDDVPPER